MKKCLILTIACLAVNDTAVGMRGFSFSIGYGMGGDRSGPFVGVGSRNGYWELNPGSFSQNRLPEDNNPQLRREREERAKSSFSNWIDGTTYSIALIKGEEYHVAQNSQETFITLGSGRGWSKTSRDFIGYSSFAGQPSNLEFELTPLQWFFAVETFGGKRFSHAWSDSGLDFLVPEGERHRICAPSWYVDEYKAEKELERQEAESQAATMRMLEALRSPSISTVHGYMAESQGGILRAMQLADKGSSEVSRARQMARSALEYYNAALTIAEDYSAQGALEWTVAFALPGGVENLESFAAGRSSCLEFLGQIAVDLGQLVIPQLKFAGFASKLTRTTVRAARETMNFSKRADRSSTAEVRANRIYGEGRFWKERLIEDRSSGAFSRVAPKNRDKILGLIQEAKRKFNGQIKADEEGALYKFDPGHKTAKVHIEKIVKKGDGKFYGVAEVDPETGAVLKIFERRY